MGLAVNVDIPLSGRELFRLIRGERGGPCHRVGGRAALRAEPDYGGGTLALVCRDVEGSHRGWAREATVSDVPSAGPGRRVVCQFGGSRACRVHRGHTLRTSQWDLEGGGVREGRARAHQAQKNNKRKESALTFQGFHLFLHLAHIRTVPIDNRG